MSPTGVAEMECLQYLNSLPIPARVRQAAPLLLKPLTTELVDEALHLMKPHSSPGLDGVPAAMYQQLADLYVPQMFWLLQRYTAEGGGGTSGVACDHFKINSQVHFGGDRYRAATPLGPR